VTFSGPMWTPQKQNVLKIVLMQHLETLQFTSKQFTSFWHKIINFVYLQPLHLLHLFGRYNASRSAFPWLFQYIPWKTVLQVNYSVRLFPFKIFQEIYFVNLFPCKWQKNPWKTKFFNRDILPKTFHWQVFCVLIAT
jgi:hypothetical protein